ncbi:D-alanyl-D-alanine carboxypeptidase [Fictibacillus phosphorivorans]|uniref:D-alanyl-D-alanine carboxypeptidase n=1 Tax=Fictibacillus phosphorivorans TaxID=1221500 RepID=A0A160IP58_9BACL|nr:D-alanyl-D-alanine carboxypeptidase family protein [Fictibacillus phosphorivorans]ANC77730.1 D-alanyl-D-alanine carboxypeptidase [Fictibacillus phosphorivorans]
MKRILKRKPLLLVLIGMLILAAFPQEAKAEPGVSASAAVLMEQSSGRVLYGRNEHRPMRIASITKIMTAILAIESGKMNDTVTITESASRTEGSSLYLKPGEKIPLKDLVYGLMLRSGNDSAVAIAEHVGGSLDGFSYLMNQKAEEIGMKHTRFRNPHGLDTHEDHYSTAYDMAVLTRYAMNNDTFKDVSSTKVYRSEQTGEKWDRVWRNKNKMLKLYEYSTGGKTGYTKRAKRTLVSTAEKDGMELIAVTLNDPNDWDDHRNLFEWGFHSFKMTELIKEGEISGIKDKGYKGKVEAARTFTYPLQKEEVGQISSSIQLYELPKSGKWEKEKVPKPVGRYFVDLKETRIADLPLYYDGKALIKPDQGGLWSSFKSIFNRLFFVAKEDNRLW